MENKTIEERISKACVTLGYAKLYSDETSPCLIAKSDAIYIVEDQDSIARQEERERCVNAAQDCICNSCGFYKLCKIETTTDVGYYGANGTKCMDRVNIRKALEGGEG